MKLTPRLIVRGADNAIAFYQSTLGARVLERFTDPALDNRVVHAALEIGNSVLSLADEHPPYGQVSPQTLGGTPILLSLEVDDADAVGEAMVKAGATVVIPIEDRFYGKREGRLCDPFGFLWIVSQKLAALSDDEIARRMAASHG
jgi:PhnB protein